MIFAGGFDSLGMHFSRTGPFKTSKIAEVYNLDWRNAESLARIIAVIRITCVHWQSNLPPNAEFGSHRPCVRRVAIRIQWLAFVGVVLVPRGTADRLARVVCVR